MWYVVRYQDVRTAPFDATRLTTESPQSTIFDTFGAHILTTEGATHDRYREASRHPFAPGFIRPHLETAIRAAASALIGDFEKEGQADLRAMFASRLPIQVMVLVCGLPADTEPRMRRISPGILRHGQLRDKASQNFMRCWTLRSVRSMKWMITHYAPASKDGTREGEGQDRRKPLLPERPRRPTLEPW
jgi:cytochrome P450